MDLTGPEHYVARQQARGAIRGQNLCRFCKFKQELFAVVICSGTEGRTFRKCTTDGLTPTFTIDPNFTGVGDE